MIRYRAEYELLRASGIGDWSRQVQQFLAGPNYSLLSNELRENEINANLAVFTRPCREADDSWIIDLVSALRQSLRIIGETPSESKSVKLMEFIHEFPRLRNKMDAHGAPTSVQKAEIAELLEIVVDLLIHNLQVLQIPLVRLDLPRREGLGGVRVLDIVGTTASEVVKGLDAGLIPSVHESGVFVVLGSQIRRVNLIACEPDLRDFLYANGSFREESTTSEFLSYITNTRRRIKCERWTSAPASIGESITAGEEHLRYEGHALTNYPQVDLSTYVHRPRLERELISELVAPYRRIVTLRGIGGIGKTTLALSVVREACDQGLFDVIIWASARDLDLIENTSRQVRPSIQSRQELAELSFNLVSQTSPIEGSDTQEWFGRALGSGDLGRVLWVLDNFETLRDPLELYATIDRALGPTNRVLITTRHRDFYGDYQIEVRGLERDEFNQLVAEYCERLSMPIRKEKIDALYRDTDGHPYITKMLLSEMRQSPLTATRSIMNRSDLQDDLLERTYSRLTESAAILFLLLSTFNSAIPATAIRVAVKSGEIISEDIDALVEELAANSLVEVTDADFDALVHMPSVAQAFGRRKLVTADFRTSISAMSEILKLFGPITREQARNAGGASDRTHESILRFWATIRRQISSGDDLNSDRYLDLAREVARSHSIVWRWIAEFLGEVGRAESAIAAWKMYIEAGNTSQEAWLQVARLFENLERSGEALSAWVSRACCDDASISDVSLAANKVNGWLATGRANLNPSERVVLIEPLVLVLEQRIDECSAVDLSRLAHLHKKLGNFQRARAVAELGLNIDPDNLHCQRLLDLN